MPLVKIVKVDSYNTDSYSGDSKHIISGSLTDWEEISTEDLALIKKYKWQLKTMLIKPQPYGSGYGYDDIMILELDDTPLTTRIADLKALVQDQIDKELKAAKKRKDDLERRKLEKARQKEIQERKTLTELAKKHGLDIDLTAPGGAQGAK